MQGSYNTAAQQCNKREALFCLFGSFVCSLCLEGNTVVHLNPLCHPPKEEPDVRLAIQEALSMMVGAYANLQGALLNLMEALVAAYIGKVSEHLRN